MTTIHLHRPRDRQRQPRPPAVQTTKVTAPYRAEHKKKKIVGTWRENVEEAFADAKLLGSGAAVVSSERVLLARFENATKLAGREMKNANEDSRRAGRPSKNGRSDDEILDEDE